MLNPNIQSIQLSRQIYAIITYPWTSYLIYKLAGCACAGNAGNGFLRLRLQRKLLASEPDMHHGTCVTHVPWCMSGSLTRGGGGKHSRRMHNPLFHVSGKRPMLGSVLIRIRNVSQNINICFVYSCVYCTISNNCVSYSQLLVFDFYNSICLLHRRYHIKWETFLTVQITT